MTSTLCMSVTLRYIQEKAVAIRKTTMGSAEGKLFLGVEPFDYTKGIREKLLAYRRYFELYPDRLGKDVFFQVAVVNRRSVETYAQYQDECCSIAASINESFKCSDRPDWKPLIFQTSGLARPDLVAYYLASDVGVVTPRKDGMNLVAKELLICNPNLSLIISVGAGTEAQLNGAGFYTDEHKCYHRVDDLTDVDAFAATYYAAAIEEKEIVAENGKKLNEFLIANDIEKWSTAFLDPSWTHDVIRQTVPVTLNDFFSLMLNTRTIRRQITEQVLKGIPIRAHFAISLANARLSLVSCVDPKTTSLRLKVGSESTATVLLDVADEIECLEKDLAFLEFIQSDEFDNVEQFLNELARYHPVSEDEYQQEVDTVITLISRGDHFNYFFTDRDGTLKSYSCNYQSSIQPSYSGVIQATFAHRCTQYAAIVTSAPLLNIGVLDVSVMPDGYFCYGASGGREWYIDAQKKFRDNSLNIEADKVLTALATEIETCMVHPEYQQFHWIGSGLQRHYGHITVAHQDCYKTIPEKESRNWIDTIHNIVRGYDPSPDMFDVHETETDIKIHLRSALTHRIFDKGDGLKLFASEMSLNLAEGNILVCGDSETDLPMVEIALQLNPNNTYVIFATKTPSLQAKVKGACDAVGNRNYAFVSCPEVILGGMAAATIREITIRPISDNASTE